jgi:hypothetical protein
VACVRAAALAALALALFCIAAKASPPPKESKGAAAGKASDTRSENRTTPPVTVIIKEIPAPPTKQITAVIQQQPYEHWWQGPQGPEWALFWLTIPYVLVTTGLFVSTRRAANAAKDAAIAAKLALQADRPLLLPLKGELQGFDGNPGDLTGAHLTFKNFGNGPALIKRILIRLNHVGKYPAKGDFSQCKEKLVRVFAVAAGGTLALATDSKDGWTDLLDMDEIHAGRRALICYGCIYYADAIDNPFETWFFWYYLPHPPAYLKLAQALGKPRRYKGIFLPAPAFNYHT